MIDPAIGALLAGAFALLFASAAFNKLHSLQRFAEVFRAYRLLPDAVARLAWLGPALQLTVGVGLLAPRSRAGARGPGRALLLAYAAAIRINLRPRPPDPACGCGGPHLGGHGACRRRAWRGPVRSRTTAGGGWGGRPGPWKGPLWKGLPTGWVPRPPGAAPGRCGQCLPPPRWASPCCRRSSRAARMSAPGW